MKRNVVSASLAIPVSLLVATLVCGCHRGAGANACGPKHEVSIALVNMPNTLDWSRSNPDSWPNYPVMHAIMRGLTTLDERGQPVPDLAERWDVELTKDKPPRQIYTFHLRKGVTWSDGKTPLTAQDFLVGWRRALEGNGYGDLDDLVGYDEVEAAQKARPRDQARLDQAISKVALEAVDANTFRVTIKSPRTYFLSRVALVYNYFPDPSADLAKKSEDEIDRYFNEPTGGKPLTLGAFHVASWDHLGSVHLVPSAGTADGIDKLSLTKQESKIQYDRCDVAFYALDDASLLRTPPPQMQRQPLMSTYWLGMKVQSAALPLALRHAISHAIDREAAVKGLVPSVRPAFGLLPPEVPGAITADDPLAKGLPIYDAARARAEVEKSGYKGQILKLLVASGTSFMPEVGIADSIRHQLEAVGIHVQIVTTAELSHDVNLTGPDGEPLYPLYLKRIGADFAHPQTFFTMFEPGGHDATGWEHLDGGKAMARFEALLTRGAAETDLEKMKETYTEAQRMLLDEFAVIVPIYHPDRYFLRRPWLTGLTFSPFNFLSFRTMRVQPVVAAP